MAASTRSRRTGDHRRGRRGRRCVAVGAVWSSSPPAATRPPTGGSRHPDGRDRRPAGRRCRRRRSSPLAASDKSRPPPASRPSWPPSWPTPTSPSSPASSSTRTTGTVLWNKDSNAPQIPASTAKLLTGAALLTSVDPTSRFVTKVVQGDQEGDIVLVGGGDVTLSARNEGVGTVYDGAPLMADLAAQVKASGVDVKRIVLDTEYWTGPDLADGWQTGDIRGTQASAQGYITRMSPLMVDGDREDPANENSIRTGDPANTAGKALARLLGTPDLPLVDGTAPEDADGHRRRSPRSRCRCCSPRRWRTPTTCWPRRWPGRSPSPAAPRPASPAPSAAIHRGARGPEDRHHRGRDVRRLRALHQGPGAAGGAGPGRRAGRQGRPAGAAQPAHRAAGRRRLRQPGRPVPGRRLAGPAPAGCGPRPGRSRSPTRWPATCPTSTAGSWSSPSSPTGSVPAPVPPWTRWRPALRGCGCTCGWSRPTTSRIGARRRPLLYRG